MNKYDEQVYNRYYDTAGNYHWTGVYSGEHIERGGRMNEYISKQKAIKIADSYMSEDAMDIREEITLLPASNVRENVRGKWEDCSSGWMCSKCYHSQIHETNFCPNCGADMKKGEVMAKEEAIKCLRDMIDGMPFDKCADWIDACRMAIKSLEAWDEVKKEIKSFQEETKNPVYKLAFGSCLVSIEEHLKEVEE